MLLKPKKHRMKVDRDEALRLLIGENMIGLFTRQEGVESFADGRDSLPDVPVSFASDRRVFAPRRVITRQIGEYATSYTPCHAERED